MKKSLMTLCAAAALAVCGNGCCGTLKGEKMGNAVYFNPVFPHGADPWSGLFNGKFYMAKTCNDGIELYCADRLSGLSKSHPVRIYTGEEKTDHYRQFWAPEFFRIDGVWYCYFTAGDGDIKHHRMFVLRNRTEDLLSGWEFAGALTDEKDGWCIDGTVFTHKGRNYMVYAHGTKKGEELVIRPMLTPEKLGIEQTVISHPSPEEKGINEGPVQLKTAKRNLLVFSTHQSHTDDYQLTCLELVGDDPMKPECWKRREKPFMTKSKTEFGPGHCTFFTDDAGDVFIAMQTYPKSGTGWAGRAIWVQKLIFDADGYPAIQHPVRIAVPQAEPIIKK